MNKKVISIGFVALLFAVSLTNIILPQREFSENENRYLTKFPDVHLNDIVSGKFTSDFENYSSDQFLGRDNWISLKTIAELGILKKDNQRVYFGKSNTLFNAEETIDKKQLSVNTKAVATFAKKLRQTSPYLKTSLLLVPTASEIQKDKLPRFAPVSNQQQAIQQVIGILGKDAIVTNSIDLLNTHKNEYLYYRTDHHWTTDAAYLVYTQWAKENNLTPLSSDAFTIQPVSDSFFGTLYSKANLRSIPPDSINAFRLKQPIEVIADYGKDQVLSTVYFDKFLSKKDKYSYFMGGNHPKVEIQTSTKNGKTLLVLQDSYAHCFIPFLTAHYENILVLDPRYLNIDFTAYAKQNNVTDLLVLYNLPNFSVDKNIARILK